MNLEVGKYYWCEITWNENKKGIYPLLFGRYDTFIQAIDSQGGSGLSWHKDSVKIIREVEAPPAPPFEPGFYFYKTGTGNPRWVILHFDSPPTAPERLGDKVEVPEKYRR